MYQAAAEVVIRRPIEEVFAFVADSENDPLWAVPVLECRRVAGEAPGVGTEYTYAADAGLFKIRGRIQIVEFKPPTTIAWELESWAMRTWPRFTFTAVDEGTHLNAYLNAEHRLLFRPFEFMQKGVAAKAYRQQLQNLKAHLETTDD